MFNRNTFVLSLLGGLFIVLVSILGCGNPNNNYPYGYYYSPNGGGSGNNGGRSAVSYASLQANLFSPYCTRCHPQYGSYQGVVNDLSNVYSYVVGQAMPPGGGLNSSLIQSLASWAQSGAPNN